MKNQEVGDGRKPRSKRWKHWQKIAALLMAYDFLAVCLSYFLALSLRFDMDWFQIPAQYLSAYQRSILPYALFCVLIFRARKLYSSIWRFASYVELTQTLFANALTIPLQIIWTSFVLGASMPLSYYAGGAALQLALTTVVRFGYRFLKMEKVRLSLPSLSLI